MMHTISPSQIHRASAHDRAPKANDTERLRVVVVDEELPYPPVTGKRLRTFNLLTRLARRHDITYICHRNSDPNEADRAIAKFYDCGIKPIVVDRVVPPKSGLAFYARLAANLFSPFPYSVAIHRSAALRHAVEDYAAHHPVDLWHCEWTPYFEAVRGLTGARRLVMAHNVESQIWRRYYETEKSRPKRWYIGKQWRKFAHFERQTFTEADRVIAVSPEDAHNIVTQFVSRHVDVVDNGVDTNYFRPQSTLFDAKQILFLGSLDWRPNLDAVDQLLEHIFPSVRAIEPAARLCIVGRNPPQALHQRVSTIPNVELHGNVPDVRQYLAECGMLAVPLRIGGGSRLKILEALATGVPVVSTRVGAEGLSLEPGRHLTVVEHNENMAAALVETMRNPETARARAAQGREHVLERYDWNSLADKLERVWLNCAKSIVETACTA